MKREIRRGCLVTFCPLPNRPSILILGSLDEDEIEILPPKQNKPTTQEGLSSRPQREPPRKDEIRRKSGETEMAKLRHDEPSVITLDDSKRGKSKESKAQTSREPSSSRGESSTSRKETTKSSTTEKRYLSFIGETIIDFVYSLNENWIFMLSI